MEPKNCLLVYLGSAKAAAADRASHLQRWALRGGDAYPLTWYEIRRGDAPGCCLPVRLLATPGRPFSRRALGGWQRLARPQ